MRSGNEHVNLAAKKSPFHMPGPLLEKVKVHIRSASLNDIAGNNETLTILTNKFRGEA